MKKNDVKNDEIYWNDKEINKFGTHYYYLHHYEVYSLQFHSFYSNKIWDIYAYRSNSFFYFMRYSCLNIIGETIFTGKSQRHPNFKTVLLEFSTLVIPIIQILKFNVAPTPFKNCNFVLFITQIILSTAEFMFTLPR